ncbi:Winged helix-turn-helix transcription repressor DNA-binding [Penicillium robsamsonii]|uniref:Winged helix-turn-helix transcription repressor DNA-binding n=1 Tax=Penicillium robsamsonii TaxID=1792511 RepID=UPI002546610D|nr:Winged helix-turn-helix transcription repressor DNA-binding [Penicillium robsamsonii]KAJ5835289.1 Winged helix-turn-helix transcription repressor DNA-binding [Penicillium robsamsonii]
MPRSEEAEWWANAVYGAIQEIPRGKVTSYGHIARLLGEPQRPRQVGVCLKVLASPESGSHFNSNTVPWQRVINSKGMISHRGPGSAERQAEALAEEGVEVTTDSMGEMYVDFSRYGWFPSELPSEGADEQY